MTFEEYYKNKKIKKGGFGANIIPLSSNENNKFIVQRSFLNKNPDFLSKLSSGINIIIVDDDDNEKIIDDDKDKKAIIPAVKEQLNAIKDSKNDDDLNIALLKNKIETIDRENQNQRINDIKQMQLMNMNSQINSNNNNNNNTFANNLVSSTGTGAGLAIGFGLTSLLFNSFMYHPYYSYNYGFYLYHYYPDFYDNSTIVENNYYISNDYDNDTFISGDNDYSSYDFSDF